jgi:hypothetical protein
MQSLSKRSRVGLAIAGVALSVGLASCGGKDDGTPPVATTAASNTPPASASASVAGFIAYLKLLVVTMPENTTPLDVSAFVAPTDDTGPFDPSI